MFFTKRSSFNYQESFLIVIFFDQMADQNSQHGRSFLAIAN